MDTSSSSPSVTPMDYAQPPNKSAFYQQVWQWVRQVPEGRVVTYGQLADWVPAPDGIEASVYLASRARWVGGAMAACPEDVPWHRVINAKGKVSQRPEAKKQQTLLVQEGVVFSRDTLDLAIYQWHGPGQDVPQAPIQTSLF